MVQTGLEINQLIYEKAGDWLARHRGGALDAAEKKAFDAWLRRSPEHIRAYLEMSAIWEDLASIEPSSGGTAAELIARAASDDSVVPMPDTRESGRTGRSPFATIRSSPVCTAVPKKRSLRYPLRFGGPIAAACIVAALVSWWVREPGYSTGIGQQRSITLADGSTVELNGRSKIQVHFVAHERDVDLIRGQALFHIAKDPQRPFIVRAGETRIRAVGTQFDVNELKDRTVVTVVEGLVAVLGTPQFPGTGALPSGSDSRAKVAAELVKGLRGTLRPTFLSTGEQLTVTAKQLPEAVRVNVPTAIAWTQHHFAFEDAPLTEVVEEFNRYNARRLVIVDPELDDVRINGFFSSTDPSVLLRFLRNQPEMSVEDVGDEIRITKR